MSHRVITYGYIYYIWYMNMCVCVRACNIVPFLNCLLAPIPPYIRCTTTSTEWFCSAIWLKNPRLPHPEHAVDGTNAASVQANASALEGMRCKWRTNSRKLLLVPESSALFWGVLGKGKSSCSSCSLQSSFTWSHRNLGSTGPAFNTAKSCVGPVVQIQRRNVGVPASSAHATQYLGS